MFNRAKKFFAAKRAIPAKQAVHDQPDIQYHRSEQGAQYVRKSSFIEMKFDGKVETLYPTETAGKGRHAIARLFTSKENAEHQMLVKQITDDKDYSDRPRNQAAVDHYIRCANKELMYQQKANPELAPHWISHFIKENGEYDYRLIRRYVPGSTLNEFINNEITDAASFALLALKIAEEVKRLHLMGFYHGDLRDPNIICKKNEKIEFGISSFNVTFIDYNCANTFETHSPSGEEYIDEDVWSMFFLFDRSLKQLAVTKPDIIKEVEEKFPALHEFINPSAKSKSLSDQQVLDILIRDTKLELDKPACALRAAAGKLC